ncbi:MAG: hypothetical protein Q9163_003611 [Psora crenata]
MTESASFRQLSEYKPIDHTDGHVWYDVPADPVQPLPPRVSPDSENEKHLVVSPYTSLPHLLDLRGLDMSQELLAGALSGLQAVRPDYATAPYTSAFNWPVVLGTLRSLAASRKYLWPHQHFYVVVFRSRIPPTTNRIHLSELDQWAHAEATKSGGLLKYWFGVPDSEGRNLATCVWRKYEDARPASIGPGHKAAMRATMNLYTEWRIERLKLTIEDNAAGWSIEEWPASQD